jgi:hypothetical protein
MIERPLARRSAAASASVTLAAVVLTGALAAGALTGRALAQNPPTPPVQVPLQLPATPAEPVVPQYQVEVLVFANRDFDRGEELFAHENARATPIRQEELRAPPVFDDRSFGPLADEPPPAGQPPALGDGLPPDPAALGADQNEFRFRLLRPEELQLTSQYRILERNPQAYAPLLHGGWVQPGLPEADARPFDLAMLGATNPMGTIRLYLSRFLHVKLDLSYLDSAAPAAPPAPAFRDELAELPITPRYHLVADRPTRSGELHYFDHPAFGVLIKVTPIRPEQQTQPGTPGTRPAA